MKPLVAGNWKMNMTRDQAVALAKALVRSLPDPLETADVALFPPYTCLGEVVEAVGGTDITVGAQNFYPEDKGAFTGEISGPMLLDVGATRVLVGHSERRHVLGEDNGFINRKMHAALAHDIEPILCVGETIEQREAGRTGEIIAAQVKQGLQGIAAARSGEVTLAYEPVWAIGTGLTASPDQAAEVHAAIRKLLTGLWGAAGETVRILYGGSVKPNNAAQLMKVADINGALVGGASLQAESFAGIIRGAG